MWHDLSRRLAKGALRLANWLVDGLVLSLVVIAVVYSAYVLVDNGRVADAASSEVFESYKPEAEGPGFDELVSKNPDVCAWLTLYGTGVDYPVVQGADNEEYLNTDATGEFALSGSLFVDYSQPRDFSAPATIIYGHHMEDSLMFGAHHGVEVVAYLDVDAYDRMVYSTTVGTDPSVEDFIAYVREHAAVWDGELTPADHMLVLSTCAAGTNERHVVFARITDETYENPYHEESVERTLTGDAGKGFPLWGKIGIGILALLLVAWIVGAPGKSKKNGK